MKRRNPEYTFRREHSIEVDVTFLGTAYAPSARVAAQHARSVVMRRLVAARARGDLKGDDSVTLSGVVSNGIAVAERSKSSQRTEVAALKRLVIKYPAEAAEAVARVLRGEESKSVKVQNNSKTTPIQGR